MGFMDELRKLTQPYEDEDDFYEGADPSAQPAVPTEAQMEFESAFGGHEIPEPAEEESETPRRKAEKVSFPAWAGKNPAVRNLPHANARLSSAEQNSRSFSSIRRTSTRPAISYSIFYRTAVSS